MKKLKTLFATALLTLPLLTLSTPSAAMYDAARLEPTKITDCCWVYMPFGWRCYPC